MRALVRLCLSTFALSTALHAQALPANASESAAAACKAILVHPAPVTPDPGHFGPDCNSASYYFGLGRPRDFAAARQCAFAERAHPNTTLADIFAGPGVLSMVYANGEGVPRNTALARRFVCEDQWSAPAEVEGRLDLLNQIDHAARPPHFDLCDTATSGLSEGNCQRILSQRAGLSRNAAITQQTAHLSPAGRTAFAALQKAEAAFATLHGQNETDLSGTGRGAFEQQAEDEANKQFLADLRSLSQPAPAGPGTPAEANAALNSTYAKLRSKLPATGGNMDAGFGTMNFAGVQQTERSWLKLRDGWLSFAAAAYPAYPHDVLLARLTEERTHQLASILR